MKKLKKYVIGVFVVAVALAFVYMLSWFIVHTWCGILLNEALSKWDEGRKFEHIDPSRSIRLYIEATESFEYACRMFPKPWAWPVSPNALKAQRLFNNFKNYINNFGKTVLDEAENAIAQGDYEKAMEKAEQIASLFRPRPGAEKKKQKSPILERAEEVVAKARLLKGRQLYKEAESLFAKGKYAEAESLYRTAKDYLPSTDPLQSKIEARLKVIEKKLGSFFAF